MHVDLPAPTLATAPSLTQAIAERRTCREFSDAPVTMAQLSLLLRAAQGVTGADGQRAAPSAGGQYPVQVFVSTGNVEDVQPGTFRYRVGSHALEPMRAEDAGHALGTAAIGEQPWVGNAAVVMALAADAAHMRDHFLEQPPRGTRGDRYLYMESGAIAQNVHLQATGCGLGAVLVGGFDDDAVREALHLPEGLQPTALLCLGVPGTAAA